jgi:hypothetical protein
MPLLAFATQARFAVLLAAIEGAVAGRPSRGEAA